jgi:hypothetical protein
MAEQLDTTHTLMAGTLLVYQRERSAIWQCRFKVDDVWQRASTKERDLKRAKEVAKKLLITAEIRKEQNMPVVTRRFKDVAKLAVAKMEQRLADGTGKSAYNDYIPIINAYLIPALGNRLITNIDRAALEYLDSERTKRMRKAPSHSTMLSHNAALNVVFDEAVTRNFLTDLNRPKLEATGKKSERRPSFTLNELRALLSNFEAWVGRAADKEDREKREIMRDYVEMLVDTGARPGKELMDLKWNQIAYEIKPTLEKTGVMSYGKDEEPEEIVLANLNKTVFLSVSGKTGRRDILGRLPTVRALERIASNCPGLHRRNPRCSGACWRATGARWRGPPASCATRRARTLRPMCTSWVKRFWCWKGRSAMRRAITGRAATSRTRQGRATRLSP